MSSSGQSDPFAMLDVRTREASTSDSASPATSGISSVPGSGSSTPPVRREEERRRQLRKMKHRATGMLVAITVFFFIITLFTSSTGVWGYLQAMAEASMVGGLADLVNDDDVHRLVDEELARAVERLPLASLAGRGLEMMTAENRHHELFDAILRGLERFLDDSRETLRTRFAQEAPWWLPEAVDDRIFERLFDGVCRLLRDVNRDPDHEVRRQFDTWLDSLIDRLEHSPEMQERVDELKREVLEHPQLREWSGSLWGEVKEVLREQAAEPDSEVRQRIADGMQALGHRLCEDEGLRAKAEQMIEDGVAYMAEHFHDELAELISGTVERWDASETSQKLELLLGRDLQWIRINGTVVGGLAGLAIHAIAQALA